MFRYRTRPHNKKPLRIIKTPGLFVGDEKGQGFDVVTAGR